MHPPSLLCMSWLFGLGIVAVRAEVAEFGACYNPASKALSCDFNSSFCRPECVKWNSGSQAVASNCEEWGPTLTWKKPSEVAAMGESCSCRETHVGSCYPLRCNGNRCAKCIPGHWNGTQTCPPPEYGQGGWVSHFKAGYAFSGGLDAGGNQIFTYCMCHNDRRGGPTQFGICRAKSGIKYRCSLDAGHCEIDERFITPHEAFTDHDILCASYDVEVGACKDAAGNHKCAVDLDSCDSGSTYMTAIQANAAGLICRLDSPDPDPQTTPAPAPPAKKAKKRYSHRARVTLDVTKAQWTAKQTEWEVFSLSFIHLFTRKCEHARNHGNTDA